MASSYPLHTLLASSTSTSSPAQTSHLAPTTAGANNPPPTSSTTTPHAPATNQPNNPQVAAQPATPSKQKSLPRRIFSWLLKKLLENLIVIAFGVLATVWAVKTYKQAEMESCRQHPTDPYLQKKPICKQMRKNHDYDDDPIKQSLNSIHHTPSFADKYIAYVLIGASIFLIDHQFLQFIFPDRNLWPMGIATISYVTGVRLQYAWEVQTRPKFKLRLRKDTTWRAAKHLSFPKMVLLVLTFGYVCFPLLLWLIIPRHIMSTIHEFLGPLNKPVATSAKAV